MASKSLAVKSHALCRETLRSNDEECCLMVALELECFMDSLKLWRHRIHHRYRYRITKEVLCLLIFQKWSADLEMQKLDYASSKVRRKPCPVLASF